MLIILLFLLLHPLFPKLSFDLHIATDLYAFWTIYFDKKFSTTILLLSLLFLTRVLMLKAI